MAVVKMSLEPRDNNGKEIHTVGLGCGRSRSISGTRFPWNRGGGESLKIGGGDKARSDDT